MSKTIDLHGLTSEEATILLQKIVIDLEDKKINEVSVITGLGSGVIKNTVERFINHYNSVNNQKIQYTIENNGGKYFLYTINNSYGSYYPMQINNSSVDQNDINDEFELFLDDIDF
ncbi:Smr/MutS family protein [Mycoplasmopsis felis]|uniref:Smr/MutS family protein n=1 Tax=Mycoplasmopsis felis TaxID=33923 RepID=UPI00068A155F|nr:Smr/MutS family protein [Mycoplasmopsis felis]WQQ11844.1 Smr/MutS family protein [Mycoplasmopsis felis]